MRKKALPWILAAAVLAAGSSLIAAKVLGPVEVSGYRLAQSTYTETVSATGYIAYEKEVVVRAETPGVITEMDKDLGDRVAAGDLLLSLDNTDAMLRYEEAAAALAVSKARLEDYRSSYNNAYSTMASQSKVQEVERESLLLQLNQLEADLAKMQLLAAEGIEPAASLKALEDRQASLLKSIEAVDARQDALAYPVFTGKELAAAIASGEKSLARQEEALKKYRIAAPLGGILVESWKKEGETVAVGENLFTIASDARKSVVVDVDEKHLGVLVPGKEVSLGGGRVPEGVRAKISEIAPEVDLDAGTIRFKVEILNHLDSFIKNMTVRVDLPAAIVEDAIVLPRNYLVDDGGSLFVLMAGPEGRAVLVPVSVYNKNLAQVMVTEGLSPGDVVLDPAEAEAGMKVDVLMEGDDVP